MAQKQDDRVYDQEADEGIPKTGSDVASGNAASPTSGDSAPKRKGFGFSSSSSRAKGSVSASSSSRQGSGGFKASAESDKLPLSRSALSAAEGEEGGLYNSDGDSGRFNLRRAFTKKNAKRGGIVAGISVALIGGGGGLYMSLMPLKIEHMVTNMRSKFFSTSENAMDRQMDRLIGQYIVDKVLPGYQSCGSTISKKCHALVPSSTTNNPVTKLYKTWSDVRLENKLADKYGIEFKYDSGGSKSWHLKMANAPNGDLDIGSNGERFDDVFNRADRSEMRGAIREATKDETRWNKMMYRYKVGRLLERKYGIKRCLLFCGTRDKVNTSIENKRLSAKLFIVQRVITPRDELTKIAMACFLDANCKPQDSESSSDAPNGQPESDFDAETRAKLAEMPGDYDTNLENMREKYDEMGKDGYGKHLFKIVMEKIGLGAVSDRVASAVPVVGWISVVFDIITAIDKAGPALKVLTYAVNSAASVQLFTTYATYADEVHTGEVDPRVLGSFSDSLSAGNQNGQKNDKGGTGGAQDTPIYQDIMYGNKSTSGTAAYNSLSGKASAEGTSEAAGGYQTPYRDGEYICDDGNPVPSGQKVCSESKVGKGVAALNDASDFLDTPGVSTIRDAAVATSGVKSWAGNLVSDLISKIPGVSSLTELVSKAINPVVEGVITKIISNPFGVNMSGGRIFELMAAGADVAGNTFAHIGLGGQLLTDAEVSQIRYDQASQAELQFKQKPMIARMFDTNSNKSLVSQVAMSIPFGRQTQVQSGFATITSPLKTVGTSFGSIFSGRANAAFTQEECSPFGVDCYGYPTGTIPGEANGPGKPDAYWDQNCVDDESVAYRKDNTWNDSSAGTQSEKTGTPINNTTNPCLLLMASLGAGGGLFDTSNLTDDDLTHVSSGETAGGSQQPDEEIDMAHLYDSSVDIACAEGTNDVGVQDGYHDGKKVKIRVCGLQDVPETGSTSDIKGANGKLLVNSRLSAFYVNLIQDAKGAGVSGISAAEGFRTMKQQQCFANGGCGATGTAAEPGYSNHQMGVAVDWGDSMIAYLQQHSHGLKAMVPGEDWHWSPSGN